jgi:hypothetical protein
MRDVQANVAKQASVPPCSPAPYRAINDGVNLESTSDDNQAQFRHRFPHREKEQASMRNGVTSALIAGLLAGATLVAAGPTSAQQPGSPAQKKACRPDVFRLCASDIPNVQAIVRCLRANESRLSPDCRAVFAGELR